MKKILLVALIPMLIIPKAYAEVTQDSCLTDLDHNPELATIQDKVALSFSENQTNAMLANKKTPNDEETKVILKWVHQRSVCYTRENEAKMNEYMPQEIKAINTAIQNDLERKSIDLADGKYSYGAFAKWRAERYEKYKAEYQVVTDSINKRREQNNNSPIVT
jgi:hypothetical protein